MGDITTLPHKTTFEEVADRYENAADTLCRRVLAEPYNFHQVDGKIELPMLQTVGLSGKVIAEAQKQFRANRQYTPHSIAVALKIEQSSLLSEALKDSTIELLPAFDLFFEQYGRKFEMDLSKLTEGFLYHGLTSEEIAVKQQQIRRESGLSARVTGSDGKPEFEAELLSSLDGKIIEYPIKPPIVAMRKLVPHHEPGEYIIIGGRTGMGKTYLGLNYIYRSSLEGIPTCYINLENTPKNVQKRIWQMHGGIGFKPDLSGLSEFETRKALTAWEEVKEMPFKTHHTGRSSQNILNTIRQDYYDRGIQLAVIDYIQLMRDMQFKGNKAGEIGEISAEVRALCLDLKIPLIALAQINREADKTAGKRPGLSDLKGSGDLEQDAALILLPFRPSYYNITEDEDGNVYEDDAADIHIAKGRDWGTGIVGCKFDHVRGFYDAQAGFSTQFPASQPSQPQPDRFLQAIGSSRPKNDEDIPF